MIKSSMRFCFNGKSSEDFGIINVNVNSNDMLQDTYFSNRTLNKTRIKYRDKSYFQNIQEDAKTFELQLAFDEGIIVNSAKLRAVMDWLGKKNGYYPLWFEEDCQLLLGSEDEYDLTNPKRVYMVTLIGAGTVNHFGLKSGYLSVTFETQSPYCESLERGNHSYEVGEAEENTDESKGSKIYFFNHGDFSIKPQIKIQVGHVPNTDTNNQGIRITGEAIDDPSIGGNFEPNDGFQRTYAVPITDYSKFLPFCFSEGKSAFGYFQLLGTTFYGEKFILSNKTYEFDLGYGKPYNKLEDSNIMVSVVAPKANNTLIFSENSWVNDGSTVTIGDQCFEYDYNDLVTPTNVKVDITDYVSRASGRMHLNSNLLPNQKNKVGDITYTMVGGTNPFIVKMSDHLLTDGSEINYLINTDKTTLVNDNVNISTKSTKNINQCLLRNITRNSSDLGIRKMKYLDKDFVMCLWDGESGEDYQQEINGVATNGRLVITFDNQVDERTLNNDTIKCRDIDGNQIQLIFDISKDKKIVGVTPKTNYDYDKDYYLYVSKGVKDIKSNCFNQIRKIKFHTKKINDTTSSDNYNGVSAVKIFTVFSSKKIDNSTVNGDNIYVSKNGSGAHVDVNISTLSGGTAISISPKTRYDYGQSYTLHITGIKDVDGNSILSSDKIINFSVQSKTNETVVTDDFEMITNAFIDKSITIPFNNKLSKDYLNTNTVVLEKEDGTRVSICVEKSESTPNILLVTPQNALSYNAIYYLYVSGGVTYYNGDNIENPRKFKVITMTEDYARNYNAPVTNIETSVPETGDLNLIHNDYTFVNTDKVIIYDFDKNLDVSTVNNTNIYILDSKGNKFTDFTAQVGLAGEGIKVFPNTVWKPDESYNIYVTPNVKTTNKPRIFAPHALPDANGNGDYDNALEIFRPLGFEVIKTNDPNNPYTVQGNAITDKDGNIVQFNSSDIIVSPENGGLQLNDFDSNGNIKTGTVIVGIPKGIMTYDAKRIFGSNRVESKQKMKELADTIKDQAWVTQQLKTEDTKILTFSTKVNNEKISIDLDGSISLDNDTLLITEIPKKIINQTAGDTINLYEDKNDKMDFVVDMNMLIPNKVPQGAKAYAGRASDGTTNPNGDDYTNAIDVLQPLGYTVIDTTTMTYDEKTKIAFHEGDLIIGGELAGSKSSDFDAQGNLKTSRPGQDPTDDPTDTRLERISGIPRGISIHPARRLQGSGDDQGRVGTKKAMQDWVDLIKKANEGKSLGSGYITDGVLNGVAVKYKVPSNACIYGTGADYYNGVKYLGDMGYTFVNVGLMTLAEKMSLPFKEGDLVLGGISASDTVATTSGSSSTAVVTGIPAINIGKAKRLGGADRYETEKIIKDFASSLKVRGIDAGDIVKLKITIDNADNNGIIKTSSPTGDEGSQSKTKSGIDENTRVEYHRVKAVKQLARNRVFIEFEEDIRTLHYIKEIEITDLYKLYETRIAEDYLFTAPYQIKIGDNKTNTMLDIVKAINNTGTFGVEYSQYTFKHSVVLAQIASEDEIELDAIEYGSKGNIPVSLIDKLDPKNRFLTSSLEGGKDCTQDNAIKALAKTILEQNDKKERYNKDQYNVTYDTTTLTITHKMCGKKYNDIICLANVNQPIQTPYIITNTGVNVDNGSLINLKDFLTREKQVAKWKNFTLIDGEDPKVEDCIRALMSKIKEKQSAEIITTYFKKDDGIEDKTGFNIEYAKVGEIGNIPLDTTCVNGRISGKKLKGGLDGLQVGEVILMDCESQTIVSSTGKDRYKNFNGNWLSVPLDGVMLRVRQGNFIITFAYKEKYYI